MKPPSPTLKQIMKIFERNSYLTVKQTSTHVHRLQYGAFGTHLKENLFQEWKNSVLHSNEVTVFPVSSPTVVHPSTVLDRLAKIVEHYPSASALRNNEYPFGIAMWTDIISILSNSPESKEVEPTIQALWNPLDWSVLTYALFCSSKQSVYWFDRLHRLRLRWWKSLSRMPSAFTFVDVPNTSNTQAKVNILFTILGMTQPIETILDFGPLPNGLVTSEIKKTGKDLPHLIVCESSLDSAVLTYLLDGFQETDTRNVLRLRHKLVPYKVSIVYRDLVNDKKEFHELNNLAKYISQELCRMHLSVFSNPHIGTALAAENQFTWFDELGILYVIVLDRDTLKNGILGIRNRDTTIEEQIHLAHLQETLSKYL